MDQRRIRFRTSCEVVDRGVEAGWRDCRCLGIPGEWPWRRVRTCRRCPGYFGLSPVDDFLDGEVKNKNGFARCFGHILELNLTASNRTKWN